MGSAPRSPAITGSDVEITVESVFSMKKAVAMMRGTRRRWCITSGPLDPATPLG
jgi:hypothetical protein